MTAHHHPHRPRKSLLRKQDRVSQALRKYMADPENVAKAARISKMKGKTLKKRPRPDSGTGGSNPTVPMPKTKPGKGSQPHNKKYRV